MKFIDEAIIKVSGGHGGPGCVSFRRETFVPRGGPDGGDGGQGGSVTFTADIQLGTLQDFRFKREYKAENGMHGSGTNKAGRDGESIEVRVPVGTIIRDAETNEVLIDLKTHGQQWLACKGGRGGKGNAHFVSSTFQAPKFAQPGEDGENRTIKLELKLLADVGIIGFPNAGKSTLISRISAARPKIADYPFTTLVPNLGVVQAEEYRSFVVADIPGLIEGAHEGKGLGTRFLKHIERTGLFVHLLDATLLLDSITQPDSPSAEEAIDALIARYQAIRHELGLFSEALLHKPEIVVLNKLDLIESDPEFVQKTHTRIRQRIASIRGSNPVNGEPFIISAVSGNGIKELIWVLAKELEEVRRQQHQTTSTEEVLLPSDERLRT